MLLCLMRCLKVAGLFMLENSHFLFMSTRFHELVSMDQRTSANVEPRWWRLSRRIGPRDLIDSGLLECFVMATRSMCEVD